MTEKFVIISNHTTEELFMAVERGELARYLRINHAKWVRWRRSDSNILVGQIPYLRSKNLCVYKFGMQPTPGQKGAIRITVEPIGIAYLLWAVVFIFGLLMFCIGVLLPILMIVLYNNRLGTIQEDLRQAIETWDKTQTRDLSS